MVAFKVGQAFPVAVGTTKLEEGASADERDLAIKEVAEAGGRDNTTRGDLTADYGCRATIGNQRPQLCCRGWLISSLSEQTSSKTVSAFCLNSPEYRAIDCRSQSLSFIAISFFPLLKPGRWPVDKRLVQSGVIEPLQSARALVLESRAQSNCAASYADRVREGMDGRSGVIDVATQTWLGGNSNQTKEMSTLRLTCPPTDQDDQSGVRSAGR